MKKTVLTFGLLSGAVSSLMMVLTVPFYDRIGFDRAEIIGYTTIVASSLLIFFGVRSYREHVAGGSLTFGRAFTVGVLIALVSSVCYVATWQVVRRQFAPDFTDKYAAHLVDKAKANGASQQDIDAKVQQIESFKKLSANPVIDVAVTFIEPLPIGLVVALISAAVLRRRDGAPTESMQSPARL